MPLSVIRGAGMNLPLAGTLPTTPIALAAGETFLIPAGDLNVAPGKYTFVEWFDPIVQVWRPSIGGWAGANGVMNVPSDGTNYRLANRTGCPIAARVTNVGSAYTSAPTVTASSGSSAWTAIVGGAVNSTVTITTAGTYNFTPTLIVAPPPKGGIPATMICALSGTAINSVTVIDQGAGYATAPAVTILQDPRDTAAGGGVLTTTLTGSGTVTGVVCTNQGTPLTSVPTLTFAGGAGSNAAASVLLVATATAVTFSGATNAGNGSFAWIPPSGTAPAQGATVNPTWDVGMYTPRAGWTTSVTTASPTTTVIGDGGLGQYWSGVTITPVLIYNSNGTISGATTLGTNTFGGVTDVSFIFGE